MRSDLGKIADIANMIAISIGVNVVKDHFSPRNGLDAFESLQDRAAIVSAPAKVINLTATRSFDERLDKSSHIYRMYIVSNLLTFISVNSVLLAFEVAFYEVAEETMQFNTRVVRPC